MHTYEFRRGEYVIYKTNGICEITEIRRENFDGNGIKDYYTLRSVFDRRTQVYVPCISSLAEKIRHVISREELDIIIAQSEQFPLLWIDDSKRRNIEYSSLIIEGDKIKMLSLFNLLNDKKSELESKKKQMYTADLRLLERVEKTVVEEIAFVLGITRDDVLSYVLSKRQSLNK